MQKRSDNGQWGFPGGFMELGESVQDTAKREVYEDLRIEKDCDYRLQVNLQRFLTSDKELQQLLLLKVLIETIRSIGLKTAKAKLDFDSLSLEKDILTLFNIISTDIDLISRK